MLRLLVTCLYCLGKKVSVTNSLASRFPEIAKEWSYERNGTLTPDKVTYGSSKNVWWKCPNHSDHYYYTSPNDRTYSHRGCPYCNNMEVCSSNNLAVTHPLLAAQWDYELNKNLKPENILPSYTGNVWWRCPDDPSHVWEAPVNLRVRNNWGVHSFFVLFLGCPYCSHRRFKDLSLASLYPEMAKDWDYSKNDKELSPDTISPNSEKLVWWKCEHGVEWRQNVVSRKKSYLHGRDFASCLLSVGYHRCAICKEKLKRSKTESVSHLED